MPRVVTAGVPTRAWRESCGLRPPHDAPWTLGSTLAMQGDLLAAGDEAHS